ncbi:COG3650 family protein [Photobacterium sp. DNB22_13_2]
MICRQLTLVPIAFTLLLAGCASDPATGPTPEEEALTTPEVATSSGKVQAFMLRGQVIFGHESRSIQPCGSTQQYWLHLPAGDLPAANAVAPRGYEPMYGEFIGYLEPAPEEGFAADYDARFNVKQINLLSAEMRQGCQQPPRKTRAFGNEPGWSIEIAGDTASLSRISYPAQQQTISSRDISSGQQTYKGRDFTLTITQAQCNDTMSDALYGWQSTLTWQGTEYSGCATLGATDVTQHWVGQYQGHSDLGATVLTTTLNLLPDHSAVTEYSYSDGQPGLSEKGFWQQAGDGKIKVTMAQYQGRRLISERLFTREEGQLSTRQEIINGETYELGESGLALDKLSPVQE